MVILVSLSKKSAALVRDALEERYPFEAGGCHFRVELVGVNASISWRVVLDVPAAEGSGEIVDEVKAFARGYQTALKDHCPNKL
jgi:hypothetical protein